MALKFFNTLTRSAEEFAPRDPQGKSVGLYCCGPTVHDFAHIGNFRTFVFADLVRRYLEFKGYSVRHVMNITDVEDKIISRVRENKIPLRDYTAKYEAAFFQDFQALHCQLPHETPRASEHIEKIKELITKLLARGVAYRAPDGSVYFSIEKYQARGGHYGRLLKLNFEEMRPGQRVSSDEYAKEAAADFALWKARVPEDGAVFWPSPWGEGRPGWHIECSAMSMEYLGPSFDIHLGGEDLIFPHHEDEIAQSEGAGEQAAGEPFVKYWLHGAHLLVEGRKMSKSLGNYFTLRDLLAKGFTGREVRYLLLTAHYRESFNFTLEGLQGARKALARLDACLSRVSEIAAGSPTAEDPEPTERIATAIKDALDDDLNVSRAWGIIFSWIGQINHSIDHGDLSPQGAAAFLNEWGKFGDVFGIPAIFSLSGKAVGKANATGSLTILDEQLSTEIVSLRDEREAARKSRDFKRSDAIRDELKAKGWAIEDTPKGPRLRRLKP
jgi:cysteinyl-tRNA synthetase